MERKLSDNHLNQYKAGGKLYKLFTVIESDPELSFEIRTNDEVKIYYRKKVILTITNGVRVTPLAQEYLKGQTLKVDISNPETWQKKNMIEDYFRQTKDLAYKESKKAEFDVQQNISLGSRSFDYGLLVVDMEWQFSQEDVKKEDRIPRTRIDLVAVDTKPNANGENDIYLVEVKHTLDATGGDSGMQGHVNKTQKICTCPAACDALIRDVTSIIDQKIKLGILTGQKPTLKFAKVPKMMFFLSYRNSEELDSLKSEVDKLVIPARMDRPSVQYYNYTIQLEKSRKSEPTFDMLKDYGEAIAVDTDEQQENKRRIKWAFECYHIFIKDIKTRIGSTFTLYEIVPVEGTKFSKVRDQSDYIAENLAAIGVRRVRIIAPLPGKGTIGITVPNKKA